MPPYFIMHLALGGCLRGSPRYGLTEDTGGHIAYILGEARAQARQPDVAQCEIVTRLFEDEALGAVHARATERLGPKLVITRIDSGDRRYLAKEALAADRAAFTRALIRELRDRPRLPDAIHAHFSDAADIALRVRDALGIKVIYTPHSLARDKLEAGCAAPAELAARLAEEDRAIAGADAVIASSRDECERQVTSYPGARVERIWRIHPGIDQTAASEADKAAARDLVAPFLRAPEKRMILAIARPVRKKNLAALVEAFGRDPHLRESANLVLLPGLRHSVESGESEQVAVMRELLEAIDRHGLYGSVAYPKHHDLGTVRGLYALAAETRGVFCNPALFEPFGLTILEAAAHGVPVVATECGGPRDIVGEIGHGLLADPTDISALGGALRRLLDDEALHARCARNARRNIRQVTWDRYARQSLGVIGRILPAPAMPAAADRPNKLLLCDIDNTLTGCDASARALSDFLRGRPDIAFGVATGRSLPEARRLVMEWNLPDPRVWITSVGSEIYWDDAQGLRRDDPFAQRLAQDWQPARIEELVAGQCGIEPQAPIEQRAFKRSYLCPDAGRVAGLRRTLAEAGLHARVVYSHGRLLDILPREAGKGAAARHVAARLGLADEDLIVAGDSGNDEDMIRACRNPIIVANSEPALIAAGRAHGSAFFATKPYSAGVLEGLVAFAGTQSSRSAA